MDSHSPIRSRTGFMGMTEGEGVGMTYNDLRVQEVANRQEAI